MTRVTVRRVEAGELGQRVSRGGKLQDFLTLFLDSFSLEVSSSPLRDWELQQHNEQY